MGDNLLAKLTEALKNRDIKRLSSNFISLSIFQAVNYVLPLITLPYLVRVLGPDKFGLVAFAQSFVLYFGILVDYGFSLSAPREIAIHRDDKSRLTEIFSAVFILKVILLVLSFIVLMIFVYCLDPFARDKLLYLLSFGSVVGLALFPMWYFQGMEAMKYTSAINIISRSVFAGLIFIFVKTEEDYLLVPLINSLGSLIAAILALWVIFKKLRQEFAVCSFDALKYQFKESTNFFWSRVSVSAYTSSNVFVLGLLTNNTIVGYYSIAEKIYMAAQQAYSPLVQTLYPYISKQKNVRLFRKLFATATVVNSICVIIGMFLADYLIYILSGQHFYESVLVLRLMFIALLVVVPSILLGYPFLGALGYKNAANYSVIAGSVFHIIILSVCAVVDLMNLYLVAALVIATEVVVFSIRLYFIKKYRLWSFR